MSIIGMDFGTTNSGMALYDGQRVNILPLDPASSNPRVARTALYITNEQRVIMGRAAVNEYFERNLGRASKLQRVWVGEIEVRGADMYYVDDLYVWMDVLSPGRLFLSMKTGLRDVHYTGTVVGHYFYSLEDLISLYLYVTRLRAEQQLGQTLRQVVLGRPVHFALEPQRDALAQERLLTAAFRAGYEQVYFQYEPIAAAYSYAMNLTRPETILVFDFGGGTLDITIMRLGGGEKAQVLATGGIPVAGDVFDQRLSRARLPHHFGERSLYGPRHKPMPVPSWIYDVFADWQEMIVLQRPENRQILETIAQSSRNPSEIQALLSLVSGNYGLRMFDEVEKAKRTLSDKVGAMIRLQGPGFNVFEMITRTDFEEIIRREILAIEQHLDETIAASGLQPSQIDAVIRTGGSSEIPVFQEMLAQKLGRDKLKQIDIFSSVTAGLGIVAHQLQQGEIALRAYTSADVGQAGTNAAESRVPEVNLPLLQRRLSAQERGEEIATTSAAQALVLLGGEHLVRAFPWTATDSVLLPAAGWNEWLPPQAAHLMPMDAPLLALTNRYRFLMTTPRQLLDLQALKLTMRDLYYFVKDETICGIADWAALKQQPLLVIVTSLGIGRAYETGVLAGSIEGPVPLQFDDPPVGLPLFVMGAARTDELVAATDNGRGVRLPLAKLPNVGGVVFNRKADELLVGAVCVSAGAQMLLATADGYGRRMLPAFVPAVERLNSRGRSILTRGHSRGLAIVGEAGQAWLVTTERIIRIDSDKLPLADSTSSRRLLKLHPGELVVTPVHSS